MNDKELIQMLARALNELADGYESLVSSGDCGSSASHLEVDRPYVMARKVYNMVPVEQRFPNPSSVLEFYTGTNQAFLAILHNRDIRALVLLDFAILTADTKCKELQQEKLTSTFIKLNGDTELSEIAAEHFVRSRSSSLLDFGDVRAISKYRDKIVEYVETSTLPTNGLDNS